MLATPIVVATTVEIAANDFPGFAEIKIPINDDPNLIGGGVAFQWWVVVSAVEIKVSDIIGLTILADRWVPPGLEGFVESSTDGPWTPLGKARPWTETRRAALEHWIISNGGRKHPALLRRILTGGEENDGR